MLYKYKWTLTIKDTQFINSLICDLTFKNSCWLDCWSLFRR